MSLVLSDYATIENNNGMTINSSYSTPTQIQVIMTFNNGTAVESTVDLNFLTDCQVESIVIGAGGGGGGVGTYNSSTRGGGGGGGGLCNGTFNVNSSKTIKFTVGYKGVVQYESAQSFKPNGNSSSIYDGGNRLISCGGGKGCPSNRSTVSGPYDYSGGAGGSVSVDNATVTSVYTSSGSTGGSCLRKDSATDGGTSDWTSNYESTISLPILDSASAFFNSVAAGYTEPYPNSDIVYSGNGGGAGYFSTTSNTTSSGKPGGGNNNTEFAGYWPYTGVATSATTGIGRGLSPNSTYGCGGSGCNGITYSNSSEKGGNGSNGIIVLLITPNQTGFKTMNTSNVVVDLNTIFQPLQPNTTKAQLTNFLSNGEDLNTIFQPLQPNTTPAQETKLLSNGADLNTIFQPL